KLLSEPNNARAVIGLIEAFGTQQVIFGHVKFEGKILVGRQAKHEINGLNRPRADNELIIFTPEFHRTTLTVPNGLEIIVHQGRVVELRDLKGSSTIPANGFVISTSGSARDWAIENLKLKTQVRLTMKLAPVESDQTELWKKATNIIGGG